MIKGSFVIVHFFSLCNKTTAAPQFFVMDLVTGGKDPKAELIAALNLNTVEVVRQIVDIFIETSLICSGRCPTLNKNLTKWTLCDLSLCPSTSCLPRKPRAACSVQC